MWSSNTNSILGGILVAIWLVWAANFIGDLMIPKMAPATTQKAPAAKKPASAQPSKEAAVTTTAPASETLKVLLASASADDGKKVAKLCAACHSFNKNGKKKIGPNLFGIIGKARGFSSDFTYSTAIKEMGGKWGFEDLDAFLAKPKAFMPGTKMAFPGVKKAGDRAALILYMRSQAEQPAPLPQ